ncbi:ComF family protein [Leptospira barantonii]|uniref:Amidophosphoribosyltransferase n=1 Tax=Leptospira barantonii TaxID=2023184 RepID=A0ABX4NLI8_9LEPT|nr:ComF family protein [Leptospira barantonii]PJZ57680.1 amidophosphoribosyltransferase [Leptospira barantonii]
MKLRKLLDIFLPSTCEFCGRYDLFSSKIGVCKRCHLENSEPAICFEGLCRICKEPLNKGECAFCSSRNVFFEEMKFLRSRTPFLAKVINRIKHGSVYMLSIYLCLGLKKELRSWKDLNFAGILLMPSTKTKWYRRKKRRPFESCDFVFRRIRKILSIPRIDPIEKISEEKQAGKSFADRFVHARLAFRIKQEYKEKLKGNYLVVDDVFTTGASANELARILIGNGADCVRVLTLIRTEGREFEIKKDVTNV